MNTDINTLVKNFESSANAARLMNAALSGSNSVKTVTESIKGAANEVAKLEAAQRRLEFANSEAGAEMARLNYQISETNRLNRALAKEMTSAEGSSNKLSGQLIRLRAQFDGMSESLRKSPLGLELAKRIALVDSALKTLDSNTGRFQRNVGNYATATNSLSQVLREMPAFTYSASTGILALSNNLPILVDQFRAVKAETGSTATALGVFGKSIFSATNLLTIAIGVITLVAGRMSMMADKTKDVKDAFDEALKSGAKEIAQMESLYSLATDVTASYQARKDAVDELQRQYPSYLGNLSDEAIMAGKAAESYNALNEALINNSIYKAFQAQAEEVASSLPSLYNKLNELRKQQQDLMAAGPQPVSTYSGGVPVGVQTVANSPLLIVQNEINATQKAIDATKNQMRQLLLTANQFANVLSNRSPGRTSGSPGGIRTGGVASGNGNENFDFEEQFRRLNELDNFINQMNDKTDEATKERIRKEAEMRAKRNADAAKQELELIQGWDKWWDDFDKNNQDKEREALQRRIKNLETYAELVRGFAQIATTISDSQYEREMSLIERRSRALQDSYDEELKRLELSGKSKAEIEREKQRLEAQTEAQRKQIDRDRINAARKKARSDRMADIANIISGTAVAVVNALGAKPYTPANIALAAMTGAIGLANLARAIAAPLPQFAKGTQNAPGGLAEVGEKGTELVVEPDGKKFLTPNRSTIMNIKKGSKIIPNHELMNQVRMAAMVKLSGKDSVSEMDYGNALIAAVIEQTEEQKRTRRAMERMKTTVVVNDNSSFNKWVTTYCK